MIKRLSTIVNLLIRMPFAFKNWYLGYLDIFKIFKIFRIEEITYVTRSGEKYFARPGQYDIGILSEIYISRVYEASDKRYIIQEKDTVLDVGGYIGDFTIYAARKATKGQVFVFEPIKENYEILKKNINLNKLKNINPFMKALTGKSEKLTFHIQLEAYGASSIYSFKGRKASLKKTYITSIGINDFIHSENIKQLDVIKLDCEGAEYDIIYQINRSLLKKVRILMIEYHRIKIENKTHNPESLRKFIQRHGFTVDMDMKSPHSLGMLYCYNNSFIKSPSQ